MHFYIYNTFDYRRSTMITVTKCRHCYRIRENGIWVAKSVPKNADEVLSVCPDCDKRIKSDHLKMVEAEKNLSWDRIMAMP